MLDKSVEFYSIIMKHLNNIPPVLPEIPQGFSIRFYKKGDEQEWAKIQVEVLEFPTREEALKCYDYYWQYMDELKKRQLFIIDDSTGEPVATANAWWTEVKGKKAGR